MFLRCLSSQIIDKFSLCTCVYIRLLPSPRPYSISGVQGWYSNRLVTLFVIVWRRIIQEVLIYVLLKEFWLRMKLNTKYKCSWSIIWLGVTSILKCGVYHWSSLTISVAEFKPRKQGINWVQLQLFNISVVKVETDINRFKWNQLYFYTPLLPTSPDKVDWSSAWESTKTSI